ncbi:AraC family transcriptional regulator, partial [Paenibacillus sp. TAF58]
LQVFFIHCEDYHYYETDPLEPWEMLWVHLHGSSASGYYEHFATNNEPVLQLSPESAIPALLRQILHIQQQRSARTELISSKLLVDLLTELLLAEQNQAMSDIDKPSYIEDICQTLEGRFQDSISLDQLAHDHAVSKYHLAKQFKRYTGYSPHEYLISIRMTHAKERLKYSNVPVSEVADSVGIDNVSHFINLFKERAGDTPLAYRKKWQRPRS